MKIETNSQYHMALARIEKFIEKGFNKLSKTETAELESLSKLVEAFEVKKFPMPLYTDIRDVLEHYMSENNINQTELSKKLEISNSALSEILSGKKKLNINIAKKIHQVLKIDGNLILELAAQT